MYNNKGSKCSTANVANMFVKHNKSDFICSQRADETCERFLRSAALLPDGGFLGWQIDTRTFSNILFSGLGDKVTMEDLNWIFHQCAVTSPLTSEWMEDLYTDDRRVYMLSSITGSTRNIDFERRKTYTSDVDGFVRSIDEWFCEMFEKMAEIGAVIRIIAGSTAGKTGGHGMIFISLPDEMTLRIRSMLSIAFPHMVADEVDKLLEETDELAYLPDDRFHESMARMLSALMRLKDGTKLTEETKPDDVIESEDEVMFEDDLEDDMGGEEDGAFTDIDELELSVRAYNCLKRAGIDTVEELQMLNDGDLMQVRNMGKKCMEEIKQKLAKFQGLAKTTPLQETNHMARLDGLIGLTDVKEQIRKVAAFARMKQDMSKDGNANISVALNMGFVGNPGTAKTTVARIAAGIFYEIGLLPSSELVEVGRADLVAKYIGHTAIKVKNVFAKAKGKVLFIDEAYSLVDDREGSFGDEAINTIIQEMENNREETIVIFAGYPDEMENFFSRNPGLKSRVPFTINFSDYSTEEMVKIVELEARNRGFSIGAKAYEKVTAICSAAALRPDMGNGRFCRNLIENAILGYASRIYGDNDNGAEKNYVLAAEDFTSPTGMNDTKKNLIGFHVS